MHLVPDTYLILENLQTPSFSLKMKQMMFLNFHDSIKFKKEHTHIYVNGKQIHLKLFQEWGREDRGEWWRGEFKYDIFDTL
jgi:hypothetical protein